MPQIFQDVNWIPSYDLYLFGISYMFSSPPTALIQLALKYKSIKSTHEVSQDIAKYSLSTFLNHAAVTCVNG